MFPKDECSSLFGAWVTKLKKRFRPWQQNYEQISGGSDYDPNLYQVSPDSNSHWQVCTVCAAAALGRKGENPASGTRFYSTERFTKPTQHNDPQNKNDTQHIRLTCDAQNKWLISDSQHNSALPLRWESRFISWYADCHGALLSDDTSVRGWQVNRLIIVQDFNWRLATIIKNEHSEIR